MSNPRPGRQQPQGTRRGWRSRGGAPGHPPPVNSSTGRLRTAPLSRMDLIASVSRSSGLEQGGDDLKDFRIQEEYREFIQGKLDNLFTRYYPRRAPEGNEVQKQRIDGQENLLILFRKLREGVYSSKRNDPFALEVYETSFYLAIIFGSPKQSSSIIPHLIPELYQSSSSPQDLRLPTILLSLLHHLVASYPSQSTYNQHLHSMPKSFLPRDSKAYLWLSSLTTSLRAQNYAQFARLSLKEPLFQALGDLDIDSINANLASLSISRQEASRNLAYVALLTALDSLRRKARDTAWAVLRSAYRELSCSAGSGEMKTWLSRSLCLQSLVTEDLSTDAEGWLEEQAAHGHARKKEGFEGRWIVCKVR